MKVKPAYKWDVFSRKSDGYYWARVPELGSSDKDLILIRDTGGLFTFPSNPHALKRGRDYEILS